MTFLKHALLGRFIPSIFLLSISSCAFPATYNGYRVVDAVEPIVIFTDDGPRTVEFKVDTGALRCSIDRELVKELKLTQIFREFGKPSHATCASEEVYVNSANGEECRPVYEVPMLIDGSIKAVGECSAANRRERNLKFPALLGRMTLVEHRLLVNSDNGLTKDQEEAEEN